MPALQRVTADQLLAESLLEREESLIDALLLRFHNIIELAPPPEGDVMREAAAAQCFQMKVETQALVRSAEDLLKLTRELKEYWLMEPLRELNGGEKETTAKMTEDAARVADLFEKFGKSIHILPEQATDVENSDSGGEKEKRKDMEEKSRKKVQNSEDEDGVEDVAADDLATDSSSVDEMEKEME